VRHRIVGGLLSLLATGLGCRTASQQSAAADATPSMRQGQTATAFVDVSVIPMDSERILTGQTVLVQNGRITALGPMGQVQLPAGAMRIDGRGKVLIPGLADMHAHLQPYDSAMAERMLFLWLANGVTTIRNMDYLHFPMYFGRSFKLSRISGRSVLQLRARIAAGELLGPRIYTSGPWGRQRAGDSMMTITRLGQPFTLGTQEDADQLIAAYKAAGYDFIKVHDENDSLYAQLVRAAHKVGIPFAGHVPNGVSLEHVLEAHQSSIEHLSGYNRRLESPSNIPALVTAIKSAGVWNCPTLLIVALNARQIGFATKVQWPEERYFSATTHKLHDSLRIDEEQHPADTVEAFQLLAAQRQLVKALQDSGAGLLLGTDSPAKSILPGFGVHRELQALVQAGLTPYQALTTGTRNVAAYFGTLNESGTVAVGKRADLVLLDANPLEDIRNTTRISGVMITGRWLPKAELDRRLDKYVGTMSDDFGYAHR
jgi:imidazolonepropionase-like amidohydrolase